MKDYNGLHGLARVRADHSGPPPPDAATVNLLQCFQNRNPIRARPFLSQLLEHIIRISSKRDRTETNSALVEAMRDNFALTRLAVFRCYPAARGTVVFSCAGLGPDGAFSHNAYLPERRHCRPIADDPLLQRCERTHAPVVDRIADGAERLVFPVILEGQAIYMIDVTLPAGFAADRRAALVGLIEYFGHHVSLLDYGETDTLTALPSRKTFDRHLYEILGRTDGDDEEGAAGGPRRRRGAGNERHWLAVCDIDFFKRINDTWGHLMGDRILQTFGRLMRDSFRYDDQLFRFGGEEFLVVLQPASPKHAHGTFERFRQNVADHVFPEVGRVTISIGYCVLRPDDTPTALIDRADAALYWAKQNGRNRVACYDELLAAGLLEGKAPA